MSTLASFADGTWGVRMILSPREGNFAGVRSLNLFPALREFSRLTLPQLVYSGPEGTVLTGVGVYNDRNQGLFAAPPDRNMRWSDAGYHYLESDVFGAMTQYKRNGRHGFLFHAACWRILEEASRPAPVPLQRLLEICRSVPIPIYGAGYDMEKHFPWQDWSQNRSFPHPEPIFSEDPYQVPKVDVDHLLAGALEFEVPPAGGPPSTQTALSIAAPLGKDCFISLPQELCTAIAIHLPTKDLLSARLASSAFWPIFHSQQFWASRFKGHFERAWLFEAGRNVRNGPSDWRYLYRRTSNADIGPGLLNRRRVWGFAQGVVGLLALAWNEPQSDPMISPLADRVQASGYLINNDNPNSNSYRFSNGCYTSRRQTIAIPEDLTRLSISTVSSGDQLYITGMALTSAAGDTIRFGYHRTSGIPEYCLELSELRGFHLAVGSGGIQALQCITGPEDSTSAWLECPNEVPRTERLAVDSRIVALEAGFDAYKMVSLAIHCKIPPLVPEPSRHGGRLRTSAVWYPDVPAPNLCLHEDSFRSAGFFIVGYNPLFWTHFGGPGGKYLQHLTGILVRCTKGIRRIDFFYNTAVPAECRSFGLCDSTELNKDFEFAIDGPGGERIDSIEMEHCVPDHFMAHDWCYTEGSMASCKFHTNRGRTFLINQGMGINHDMVWEKDFRTVIKAAPGTVITGLYATERPHDGCGITAMGVISEEVGETDAAEETATAPE